MIDSAYLTTTGRKTGLPRNAEVWFVRRGDSFFFLAHPWSMWWRNLESDPRGALDAHGDRFEVEKVRISDDADCVDWVMALFREKYGAVQVRAWYERGHRRAVWLRLRGRGRDSGRLGADEARRSGVPDSGASIVKPLVKICGLTRPEDAALAVQLGATHVGVVSTASSPRYVDAAGSRRVFEAVQGLAETVLVMRDLPLVQTIRRARESGTGTVQLCEASDEDVRVVEAEGFRVFRGYRVDERSSILPALEPEPSERQPALLDVGSGGTGRRFDWSLLDPCAPKWTFVAGGIRPGNVRELLTKKPYGIDLASGVESAPGIKDESKLRAFFSEVS